MAEKLASEVGQTPDPRSPSPACTTVHAGEGDLENGAATTRLRFFSVGDREGARRFRPCEPFADRDDDDDDLILRSACL